MSITVTTLNPKGKGFALNATSADASGCEEILAAQGAGTNIVLRQATIACATAITVTIGEGETGGAVTNPIIGPLEFNTNGQTYQFVFNPGIVLTANESLTVDASGSGAICIFVQGDVQ